MIYGDWFGEIIDGTTFNYFPANTMYRIETIEGELVEFQQSLKSPDYTCLYVNIEKATKEDLEKSPVIRFAPNKIVHIRPYVSKYYPYGVSCLEKYKKFNTNFELDKPILDNQFEDELTQGICELVTQLNNA